MIRDEVRDTGITMGELEGENTEGTGQVRKLKQYFNVIIITKQVP